MTTDLSSYRLAVDAAEHGVWDYDLRTGAVTCSSLVRTMLGFPAYRTIENMEDFESYILSDDLPLFREAITKLVETFSPLKVDIRMNVKDGGFKWISLRGGFQVGPNGVIERISAVLVDVDEYKHAEVTLNKIIDLLSLDLDR